MGISSAEAADLGVAIYKVGMPWPLEPQGIRAFAAMHHEGKSSSISVR